MNFFKKPFVEGYDSEKTIKKIATATYGMWQLFAILSTVIGIILLLISAGDLGFIIAGVATIFGGLLLAYQGCIFTHFIWGFGELIGNSKKSNPKAEKTIPLMIFWKRKSLTAHIRKPNNQAIIPPRSIIARRK